MVSYKAFALPLRQIRLKPYLLIAKPGIVFGNLIAMLGGALLASRGRIDMLFLLMMLTGVACVVASGCVLNNIIDRDIDACMERTRERVLVKGDMTSFAALTYAALLAVTGLVLLYMKTTALAALCAATALFIYVAAYSLYFKRHSVHGTLVGSLAGAFPAVIGYVAVTGRADAAALILFAMFCLWQMPHSYAIAIFRENDYRCAELPVLPLICGVRHATRQCVIYVGLFIAVSLLLYLFHYVGFVYLIIVSGMGVCWFWLALSGFSARDSTVWAKSMFICSNIMVIVISVLISTDFL